MKKQALAEKWFAPQAVYGYFPAHSDANDIVVFDPAAPDKPLVRFTMPRQGSEARLCLADYVLPVGSPTKDVVALQVVTMGPSATDCFDKIDERSEYSEAYYFHGLAVQTAEAATMYVFERIRKELGLADARAKRYSWGFPAMPDVEDHRKVFALLPAEKEIGMTLTSAGQLDPRAVDRRPGDPPPRGRVLQRVEGTPRPRGPGREVDPSASKCDAQRP